MAHKSFSLQTSLKIDSFRAKAFDLKKSARYLLREKSGVESELGLVGRKYHSYNSYTNWPIPKSNNSTI